MRPQDEVYSSYIHSVESVVRLPRRAHELNAALTVTMSEIDAATRAQSEKVENEMRANEARLLGSVSSALAIVREVGHGDLIPDGLPAASTHPPAKDVAQALSALDRAANGLQRFKQEAETATREKERLRSEAEDHRQRTLAASSKLVQIISVLVIVVGSGVSAGILNSVKGGSYPLFGLLVAIAGSVSLGGPIGAAIAFTGRIGGLDLKPPSYAKGLMMGVGVGILAVSVGAIISETWNFDSYAYSLQFVIGGILLHSVFKSLTVSSVKATPQFVLPPPMWDGLSGLAAFLLASIPVMAFSSGDSKAAANGIALTFVIVAAANPMVGGFARIALRIIVNLIFTSKDELRPGAIVWARIAFEDEPTSSKDRPNLIVGERGDSLQIFQMTSKYHPGRTDELELGRGDWDPQRRVSYLKIGKIVTIKKSDVRRHGGFLDGQRFDMVMRKAAIIHPELFSKDQARSKAPQGWVASFAYGGLWAAIGVLLTGLVSGLR